MKPIRNIRIIMEKLKNHKYTLVIFFLFSLIPFYWLRGHPIGWGDTGLFAFFYNSKYLFNVFKYAWASQYLTGFPSGQTMSELPLSGLFSLLTLFGLSNYIQQAFVYFLVLFTSMTFTYLFVYEIFDYRTDKKLVASVSAIFYVFNPLVMVNYWYMGMQTLYVMPFIPITLFFFLSVLKKQNFFYLLLTSLIFSFLSIVFFSPPIGICVIMILALFFVYQIVLSWKNWDRVKKMFIYTAILVILTFLINTWFILPFLSSVTSYYTYATTQLDPLKTLIGTSQWVSLTTFFRLLPLKLDIADILLYKNVHWRYCYNNPFFIMLGIFIFLFVITPLMLKKKDKNTLFFTLLLIMGLFLCLGLNSPFGFIFGYMFKNIPYFDMFRMPYNKFLPFLLISSSILFGIGVTSLYRWIIYKSKARYARLTLIVIMFLTCGVYVFPMWTGSIVNAPITIRGNRISSFIEVPSYYSNIAKYFHKDPTDYRILSLPLRPFEYVGFGWEYGYDGPDVTWLLYRQNTISYLFKNYYSSAKIISELGDQNLENNLYKITSLFGIKYIVIQNDVDIVHGNYLGRKLTSQEELKLMMDRLNVPFISSFGKLDFYKISDEYFLPHIYASPDKTGL